jgi:hypothetical protein
MNYKLPERRHPVGEILLDIGYILPVLLADFGISLVSELYFRIAFRLIFAVRFFRVA